MWDEKSVIRTSKEQPMDESLLLKVPSARDPTLGDEGDATNRTSRMQSPRSWPSYSVFKISRKSRLTSPDKNHSPEKTSPYNRVKMFLSMSIG